LCRWMSPDPAGTVDGPNLYAYVGGDPVGFNDPTGMAGDEVKKPSTRSSSRLKRQADTTGDDSPKVRKLTFEQERQEADKALALGEGKKEKKVAPPRKKGVDKFAKIRKKFPTERGKFGRALHKDYLKFYPKKEDKVAAFDVYGHTISVYWNATNPYLKGGPEALQDYSGILSTLFNMNVPQETGAAEERTAANQRVAGLLLERNYEELEAQGKHIAAAKLEIIVGIAEEFRKKGAVAIFEGVLRRVKAGQLDATGIAKEFRFTPRQSASVKLGGAMQGREQVATAQLILADTIERSEAAAHYGDTFMSEDYYSQDPEDYDSEVESDHEARKGFNPSGGYKIPTMTQRLVPPDVFQATDLFEAAKLNFPDLFSKYQQ
ncbi:MAG: RHS repeat-associated core domain-containing protein, partial [Bacteroidia bacterium]